MNNNLVLQCREIDSIKTINLHQNYKFQIDGTEPLFFFTENIFQNKQKKPRIIVDKINDWEEI